jgi:translocation and assembly module TamB
MLARGAMAAAALALVVATGAVLVVRSEWFHEQVRRRIVREIENSTGARVELGGFRFDWRAMQATADELVVHGLEGAEAPPLFRAGRVVVGLKVISALRRKVDIESLEVEEPAISIAVDAAGRTNIPEPRVKRSTNKKAVERFVDLAVGSYRIAQGELRINDERIPLEVAGRELELSLDYARDARAYDGRFRAAELRAGKPLRAPAGMKTEALWRLTSERVEVKRLAVEVGQSRMVSSGVVEFGERVTAAGEGSAEVALAEVARWVELPVAPRGRIAVSGKFSLDGERRWQAAGTATAAGVAYAGGGVRVDNVGASTAWEAEPAGLRLTGLKVAALGGKLSGSAELPGWRRLRLAAQMEGVALSRLLGAQGMEEFGYEAMVAGGVEVELPGARVATQLTLSAVENRPAVTGELRVRYDGGQQAVTFGESHLEFPHSRLRFQGSLEERVEVALVSKNLDDLLPLVRAGGRQISELPVRLEGGQLDFAGMVRGALKEPVIAGRLNAGPLVAGEQRIERVAAAVEASGERLRLSGIDAAANGARVRGQLTAQLAGWRLGAESMVSGRLELESAELSKLLRQAGSDIAAEGTVSGAADVEGTYGAPRVSARVRVAKPRAWEETFDWLEAEVRYSNTRIEISDGKLSSGGAAMLFAGSIAGGSEIEFQVQARNWRLRQFELVRRQPAQLDGSVALRATGAARRRGERVELTSLNGQASVEQLTVNKNPAGRLSVTAETRGRLMTARMEARLRDSEVSGNAEWSLGGNSLGLGQIRIPRLVFADLQQVGLLGEPGKELAFRGEVAGEIGFSGPVLRPERWTGLARITRLEVEPARGLPGAEKVDPSRLLLRNREPLTAQLDRNAITIQAARLVAEGTDLEVRGAIGLQSRNPWNLQIKGRLNLPSLSTFEPDLVATGVSVIDASVRGSYDRPQLLGRMEIRDASFRLRDVPNGLEQANGLIVFDRTRANIESFSAQTGGGQLNVKGFVGLAGPELLYRLQADMRRIRVRYPESVSTTFNGTLNLTGTATQSVLNGNIVVTRVSMNPQTDIGGLLQDTGGSKTAAPQSGFLRGMQLDLRIETSPDAELQTSLTRDLQPEAELRVRGSVLKPVLLGRVSVNQGEINFFGNRYTITRGEVSFFNTAKVEPVLDLDLETRVRGIAVTINFTGPIDKLAVSYRSDPPLQSAEIIALLTVGRAPGSSVTPNMPMRNQNYAQTGANSLLGQAISAPITGRLERLFGVSRIKIDPDLTGVTNTAQARLTVEQQLSRDITITYITNLNRTQQQIVRLQWDFSQDFSVLAVRDENGIFGVDFLWRKRFK